MPSAIELNVSSVQETVEQLFELSGETQGDEYQMLCPSPDHPDSTPSCAVNLITGYWNCFSCGIGGDLAQLGVVSMGATRHEVLKLFKPNSTDSLMTIIKSKLHALEVHNHMKEPLVLPGPYETEPMYELRQRGFKDHTLRKWGIQFCIEQELEGSKGPFTILNSLAIPIRDENRRLLCWCYRSTSGSQGWQPRYLYTPGVDINELWFGKQHHKNAEEIVIVEGALDAMWLDQCGIPALGMLGSSMGRRKILELQRYNKVTLLGDKDSAGVKAVRRLGEILENRVPLFVGMYPSYSDATDPQELHPVDLEIAMATSKLWFKMR